MIRLLLAGAEILPFAATGGLGDVMGSLPEAIRCAAGEDGADVRAVMPLYSAIGKEWRGQMRKEAEFTVRLSWRNQYCGVWSLVKNGVTYYFIDNEYYFKRGGGSLYGHYDDGERYAYFCMALLSMMEVLDFYPDILHANDWQTALSVVYLKTLFAERKKFSGIRTLYTIHNIEYQGKYDFAILGDVFALGAEWHGLMEYDGYINLMKAAVCCSDLVSTVSPRYAKEICGEEYAHGLHYVIRQNEGKLTGILNGIDTVYYNPETDPILAARYSADAPEGKYKNKLALQEKLRLPLDPEIPMIVMISRLASHKGLDLVTGMLYRLLSAENVQFVILGKGESGYEDYFREAERRFPEKARAMILYDREISRQIYAAGDLFVMPSRSEPCGLAQMIASRYGDIPVVRETGGLADSIHGCYEKDGELMGNGITFSRYDADDLYDAVKRALALWRCRGKRMRYIQKIMRTDFSWYSSAKEYLSLYRMILNG